MKAFLELQGITKTYTQGEVTFDALKFVDLVVNKGEFVVIMGPSGSGKTTFLNVLGGLEPLTTGKLYMDGKEMSNFHLEPFATQYRRETIGFVFQFFNLLSSMTALENVALPLVLAGTREKEANDAATEMLSLVGLKEKLNRFPSELSGGQQQRVALARSLIHRPKILLADEPTGSLDSKTSIEMLELLQKMKKELNQSIVMVTHDPMVATYGDRVVFFQDGKVVRDWMNDGLEHRGEHSMAIMNQLLSLSEETS